MRFFSLALVASLLIPQGFVTRASAEPIDTVAAVERLFREPVAADWFAPSLLAQASPEQIAGIVKRFTDQFGPLQQITGTGAQLSVRLERAELPTSISLDENGRITGLFFQPPIPTGGSLDNFLAEIAALPGKTSVLVLSNGELRASHDPDAVLAVGSAMKLAILAALESAITEGRLAYDKVVPLDPSWRTVPTSVLIDWPAQTPVTIATLANLMVSISDNMATDALIQLVGREPIEAITPRNTPFLTTAEVFKLQANPAELKDWQAADAAGKRALLSRLDALPLPRLDDLLKQPSSAEWFMSARELCALLDRVGDLPAMTINAGLTERSDWKSVAFKGGSDSGVLNFSTRVVAADGTVHCIVATWNNGAGLLTQETLAAPYRGILKLLHGGGAAVN